MTPSVRQIGSELALPLIRAYCDRWHIPYSNTERADDVVWWGAFSDGALRAVMGIMPSPIDATRLFVYGLYNDPTRASTRAVYTLLKCLDELPQALDGTIHLPNARMFRVSGKFGWCLRTFLPDNCGALLERPARA